MNILIQETFREQTEISAPGQLALAVDFIERDVFMSVDLISWWMEHRTSLSVAFEHHGGGEEG